MDCRCRRAYGETTVYAAEGTLAHAVCELYGRKKFTPMSTRKFNSELKKLKDNELWQDEMIKTAEVYVDFLTEKAMSSVAAPRVFFEIRVDLSDYIPEGFGTCDCAMVCDDVLRITDYKHGKGVPVSSIENGQMRLYALGALKQLYPIFGDTIQRVCTAIVQPRITEDVTEEYLTVDELRAWGETVKPKAQAAFLGIDDYQFMRLWKNPDTYLPMLSQFQAVCTPDFSTYTDFPKAIQVYNHYRKHWLGAYWQEHGIKVIPTISWSDEASFEWCFDGEPVGGMVAVSSVGTQGNKRSAQLFEAGYKEMKRRLRPSQIVLCGSVPECCKDDEIISVRAFQSKWRED